MDAERRRTRPLTRTRPGKRPERGLAAAFAVLYVSSFPATHAFDMDCHGLAWSSGHYYTRLGISESSRCFLISPTSSGTRAAAGADADWARRRDCMRQRPQTRHPRRSMRA
ncbi:hypothetical protein K466DRAFT_592351 [Polyporus arcularius HHB13444]|uniref:Uncharacterized protein n=1 Tax=Polyporus arcularius HHB13444 TaxID=1314778 RepID=A0A5C3NPS3_9APHY|nr:hypothetical protein K466DRAFT_592351 [Polyporus arcularius HHB13444]